MSERMDPVTKALLRQDVFSVEAGSVVIETPPIKPEEVEDLFAFFELVKQRIRRANSEASAG